MATYYWIGGAGTWNNANTTNWSTSSGGSGGFGPPTNADTVIFDTASASGNYIVTVAATAVSLNTTVANPTGGTVELSLSGAPTLCTAAGLLTLTSGKITLNNNNLTTGRFTSSNVNTRSIAFGSGNIVLSSTTAASIVLQMASATNFSWTGTGGFSRNQAATSTIQFGNASGGTASNAPNLFITAGALALTITTASYLNNVDFTGSTCSVIAVNLNVAGNLTLATGGTYTGITPIFIGTSTITSNGKTLGTININAATVTLADALSVGSIVLNNASAVFNTTVSNYSVTAVSITFNTGTLTLNGSTVTLSGNFTYTTGTLNAGTSQINLSSNSLTFAGGGQTFYNVAFTGDSLLSLAITGANTFNTLSFASRAATTIGIAAVTFNANQTITTLTLNAGNIAANRTFLASSAINTQITLSVGTLTAGAADYDFRDIAITGAAAPLTGTRFGDAKGNSGITFPAAKTVYFAVAASSNWGSAGSGSWSGSNNGTPNVTQFPLAQDTAIFPSTPTAYPTSGNIVTVNANYNIGTIDMSARTANTMTLATGTTTPAIYGNWINGTGTTLTGTGAMAFAGRVSQTITSAGKTWTQLFTINTPGGSITLQDAFTANQSSASVLTITQGTFDASIYNVTLSGAAAGVSSSNSNTRTIAIGSGTWAISGTTSAWATSTSTGLTVTGTGTISLTSASAKTFAGGGIQTYPTLNQGGTGALTITGSNKFAAMTNTAIGSVLFTGGTTNEFTTFNLNGVAGTLLTLGSTNTTQAILKKPGNWNVGANSTDAGNNTGLSFI